MIGIRDVRLKNTVQGGVARRTSEPNPFPSLDAERYVPQCSASPFVDSFPIRSLVIEPRTTIFVYDVTTMGIQLGRWILGSAKREP